MQRKQDIQDNKTWGNTKVRSLYDVAEHGLDAHLSLFTIDQAACTIPLPRSTRSVWHHGFHSLPFHFSSGTHLAGSPLRAELRFPGIRTRACGFICGSVNHYNIEAHESWGRLIKFDRVTDRNVRTLRIVLHLVLQCKATEGKETRKDN